MEMMSPKELNDDPKRWLGIPHELHGTILPLMEKLFPGFTQRLKDAKVHCLLCEGQSPFNVIVKSTGKKQICTGYVGNASDPKNFFFSCTDPTE